MTGISQLTDSEFPSIINAQLQTAVKSKKIDLMFWHQKCIRCFEITKEKYIKHIHQTNCY